MDSLPFAPKRLQVSDCPGDANDLAAPRRICGHEASPRPRQFEAITPGRNVVAFLSLARYVRSRRQMQSKLILDLSHRAIPPASRTEVLAFNALQYAVLSQNSGHPKEVRSEMRHMRAGQAPHRRSCLPEVCYRTHAGSHPRALSIVTTTTRHALPEWCPLQDALRWL